MADYSQTPLIRKLGIRENFCCYLYHVPTAYFQWISPFPNGAEVKARLAGEFDFIHLFVTDRRSFEKKFSRCQKHLKETGMLWVSWPKKASKVPTDLDENLIRDFGLGNGLVDIKVCAINDIWSGLKFVVRVKDRIK
jgi:hypothetical protein